MNRTDIDPIDLLAAYAPTADDLDRDWPRQNRVALLHRLRTDGPRTPIRFVAARNPRAARRPLVAAATLVVGAAAAVLVGQVVLPSGTPGATTNAYAAELERLAVAAENTPADLVRPGQFRHLVSREEQTGGVPEAPTPQTRTLESWTAYDGRIWRKDTAGPGTPGGQRTEYYQFPPGGANVNSPTPQFLASLPTNPTKLHTYLEHHVSGSTSRDEAVFVAVGDMLRGGFAPPALRAAAIRMLEHAGHVTVRQGTDSSGGAAIIVSFRDQKERPGETQSLYLDPRTSAIEEETTTLCADAATTSARCTAGDHDPLFFRSVYSGSATVDAVPADVLAKASLLK